MPHKLIKLVLADNQFAPLKVKLVYRQGIFAFLSEYFEQPITLKFAPLSIGMITFDTFVGTFVIHYKLGLFNSYLSFRGTAHITDITGDYRKVWFNDRQSIEDVEFFFLCDGVSYLKESDLTKLQGTEICYLCFGHPLVDYEFVSKEFAPPLLKPFFDSNGITINALKLKQLGKYLVRYSNLPYIF